MEQFNVTGMNCAACSAHVEKAVRALPGVSEVAVNLLTGSMGVEYGPPATPEAIVAAVKAAGYGASPQKPLKAAEAPDALKDTETPRLLRRLVLSLAFLVLLMYVAMGHMLGLPLPPWLSGHQNAVSNALVQLLLSAAVLAVNYEFFTGGIRGLVRLSPGMDALVALGSGASFLYSIYITFRLSYALGAGDMQAIEGYAHGLYYESAAMIVALITVGKALEARSKGKTTDALQNRRAAAGGQRGGCANRGGRRGRYLRCAPGREHTGRRRGGFGNLGGQRVRPHRREPAG
jgi:Cu2+-exporting ATPase